MFPRICFLERTRPNLASSSRPLRDAHRRLAHSTSRPRHRSTTMVKSHVACSADLKWLLVNDGPNVFKRRSRSATRQKSFESVSAEANNLASKHSFKNSGA